MAAKFLAILSLLFCAVVSVLCDVAPLNMTAPGSVPPPAPKPIPAPAISSVPAPAIASVPASKPIPAPAIASVPAPSVAVVTAEKDDPPPKNCIGVVAIPEESGTLNIRKELSQTSDKLGSYYFGDKVDILEAAPGEFVQGTNLWYRTDKGWISGRYLIVRCS